MLRCGAEPVHVGGNEGRDGRRTQVLRARQAEHAVGQWLPAGPDHLQVQARASPTHGNQVQVSGVVHVTCGTNDIRVAVTSLRVLDYWCRCILPSCIHPPSSTYVGAAHHNLGTI